MRAIIGAAAGLAMSAGVAFAGEEVKREQVDATFGSATTAIIAQRDGGVMRTPVDSLRTCFDLGRDLVSRVSCMDDNNKVITSFNCGNWVDYCEQIRPEDYDLGQ